MKVRFKVLRRKVETLNKKRSYRRKVLRIVTECKSMRNEEINRKLNLSVWKKRLACIVAGKIVVL